MPKIIIDIENKIFEEAKNIFSEKGYHKTDMKAIARACDIAVGTLYNYYPNKKKIYMDVFIKSWDETIRKIKLVKKRVDKKEELREVMVIFYADVEDRNGLGNDLRELCKKGDKEFDETARVVLDELFDVTLSRFNIKEEFENIKDIEFRILVIWFAGQFAMMSDFSTDREENINFLYSTVSAYFNLEKKLVKNYKVLY